MARSIVIGLLLNFFGCFKHISVRTQVKNCYKVVMRQEQNTQDKWQEFAGEAQAGNKRVYAQLLSELAPYIKMRIGGGLANPDWTEEIIQDVLISVHRSLDSYSPDRPFKPWVNAIIHYRKTDFLRKHYRNKELNQASQNNAKIFEENVTNNVHAGELKDIEEALQKLPVKQQQIFKFLKIEGYSSAEVAQKMGMSISAVKVSSHRTVKKLESLLAGHR